MEGDGRAEKPTGDGEATQILALAGGCHQPRTEAQKAEVALPGQEQGHLAEHGTVEPWASWKMEERHSHCCRCCLRLKGRNNLGSPFLLPSSLPPLTKPNWKPAKAEACEMQPVGSSPPAIYSRVAK